MVFESLVVELINRYLGDFVENLDTSQLKIGIWGGDVSLNNLNLKESALDDLDLPVKVKAGHISKLVLKIPWKNLYTEAVIAEIDGIYALAVPNVAIKYNAEKEEKAKQDAKQQKLAQIEETKKLEAQKGQPKEEKKDTFAEKLATQVIKNLQVKVSNIHIRYEDRFSNPKRPFSIGVSLRELLFQTTDENWKACIIKDAVTQIYKLVRLDCLSLYWNSCSTLLDELEKDKILETLKSCIASQGTKPAFQYIVRPISSVAHLRLNTKPEQTNFSIPKIGLTVVVDEIGVGLTKDQYDDVLEMLESMERMNLMSLYRKYRPDVPLPGNTRKWWYYAYTCVLEETVRHRRQMWSWSHISEHRKTMKSYREAYVKKLDSRKVSSDVQKIMDEGEKLLDVLSITLMRQQAEVEASKLGAKRKEDSGKGWFGGWFGGGSKKAASPDDSGAAEIQNKFYELYTPEEKAKLYSAIGYEENETDLSLPVEFVAVKVVTKLRNVTVFLRDIRQKESQVMKLQLKDVYSSLGQRPAGNAIQLEAKVDRMIVSGTPQNEFVPKVITSQVQQEEQVYSLLTVAVETNPLHGKCDTSVKVKARPLEIIYDAGDHRSEIRNLYTLNSKHCPSAAGLRREQREKATPMDENPITITVTQGSTAVLPCSVDPMYTEQHKDEYKVVWVSPTKTAISIEDRRMINDMRISVERPFLRDWNLHIRNVSITDSGEFMCQLNTDPVKSKKVNLLVNVPPMIVEYTQPVEMKRMEGDLVELFCNASGVPPPTVTWYRMNRQTSAGRERVGSSGEHLVIHNVTRLCADMYTCIADNGVPPATKQEFLVEVNYPPEIELHNSRIGQELGKETILECTISASPLHVSRWRRGDEVYGKSDRYEVNIYDHNGEPNTIVLSLRIMRVEKKDYGTYFCEASNNFGEVVRPMELYEVRPKPPPTTTSSSTTTTTSNISIRRTSSVSNVRMNGNGQDTVIMKNPYDSTPEVRRPGKLGSKGEINNSGYEVYDDSGNQASQTKSHWNRLAFCLTSLFWWMMQRSL